MKINRSVSILKSRKGFILYHVLTFYMFFSTMIAYIAVLHKVSLIQQEYYKSAVQKIEVEKEVIRMIKNHRYLSFNETIVIQSKTVSIMYEDMIKVTICDVSCYMMIVTYDIENSIILSIEYE